MRLFDVSGRSWCSLPVAAAGLTANLSVRDVNSGFFFSVRPRAGWHRLLAFTARGRWFLCLFTLPGISSWPAVKKGISCGYNTSTGGACNWIRGEEFETAKVRGYNGIITVPRRSRDATTRLQWGFVPKSDYSCFCLIFFMTNICVYIQAVVYRIYVYTIKKLAVIQVSLWLCLIVSGQCSAL